MTCNELSKLAEKHVAELGEHFDNVQIHCSTQGSQLEPSGSGTYGLHRGSGDWYARQGLAHEFIEQDKAEEHGKSVARCIRDQE